MSFLVPIVLLFVALYLYNYMKEKKVLQKSKGIPNGQLDPIPYVGDLRHISGRGDEWIEERVKTLGPIFRTHFLGSDFVIISGVEAMAQFVKMDRTHNDSGWSKIAEIAFGKDSLFFKNGDIHKRIRGLILQLAKFGTQDEFLEVVQQQYIKTLSEWTCEDKGTRTEVFSSLGVVFSNVTSRYIWGDDISENTLQELQTVFKNMGRVFQRSLPLDVSWTPFGQGLIAKRRLDEMIIEEIQRREQNREKSRLRTDVIQNMINYYDEGKLTYEELVANCRIVIFAAVDTTVSSLTHIIHWLLANKEIFEKIREECAGLLGQERLLSGKITSAQLEDLKYTEAAIKEGLRCRPPAVFATRLAAKDMPIHIDGHEYIIPAGHKIITALAHTTKFYPGELEHSAEPRPERFLEKETAESRIAWCPFGNGARQCPGLNMAMAEMKLFLAMMTAYDFKIMNEEKVEFIRVMFPRPKNGLYLTGKKRKI